MVGSGDIYEFRETSGFPVSRTIDRHHIGRLLPFAFARYATQRRG
jgi:hypothetical protein